MTKEQYPQRWYENQWAAVGVTEAAFIISAFLWTKDLTLSANLIGAAIYTLGTIADTQATRRVFRLLDRDNFEEINPLLSSVRTEEEYNKSRARLYKNAGGFIISAILPPVGVALGAARILGAMNNHRIVKRQLHKD